ncbi:MAG: hypothetical protein MI919_14685 [Holophagales bacterium]|nr:hypothetical protein [Holophagales bacterium]
MADQDLWRKNIPADFQGKMADEWDGEIPMKPIVWSTVAIVIAFVIAVIFCYWLMVGPFETMRQAMVKSYVSPMAEANARRLPPTPLLQSKPEAEMDVWLETMEERTSGYGWVDQLDNRVHIPIEKGMELVLADRGAMPTSVEPATEGPVDVGLEEGGLSEGAPGGAGADPDTGAAGEGNEAETGETDS